MGQAETITGQDQVIMYTKVGCHLCEAARELLDEIAETRPFALTEIDIRSDMTTYETYRYRVPVVLVNGTVVAEGSVAYEDLASAFQL
jgi:Glutaredoxin and related proteins